MVDELFECAICSTFSGFYLEDGRCQFCGDGQTYDQTKKACSCKDGFTYDSSKNCIPIPTVPTSVSENFTIKNIFPEKKTETTTEYSERRRNRDNGTPTNQGSLTTTTATSSGSSSTQTSVENKIAPVQIVPETTSYTTEVLSNSTVDKTTTVQSKPETTSQSTVT